MQSPQKIAEVKACLGGQDLSQTVPVLGVVALGPFEGNVADRKKV